MKSIKLLSSIIGVLLFATFMLSSCSNKIVMENMGIAPAAKAYAEIKHDKNDNYYVQVKATNLAPSMNLNPPKKTYVIWMVTENNGTKNIGQFQSGSSLLSNTLKGSIKTTTTFKPVGFYISAEDDAAISYPGPVIILKSN